MGSGNNSETSSDQETISKEGFGRSYECIFCKRGFTNAQALGGHMNIHRKDKEKAKKHNKPDKDHSSTVSYHSAVSSKSFNLNSNEDDRQYVGSSLGFPAGDHGYQFLPSNPNFQWGYAAKQFDDNRIHKEQLRVNLNLGIGTSEMEHSNIESIKVGHEDWIENDVDLELRLGHYP